MKQTEKLLVYDIAPEVEAFSSKRTCLVPSVEDTSPCELFDIPYPVIQSHQTHKLEVAVIDRTWVLREELEGIDAMVTNKRGVAIGVRTADCIPVLLYDPEHKAVGAVHSGWRGTVGRIARRAIETMTANYGTNPACLKAVIGPGIGADAFQEGEEVVKAFADAGFPMDAICSYRGESAPRAAAPKEPAPRAANYEPAAAHRPTPAELAGGYHIDLPKAVQLTLVGCGVPEASIEMAGICTYSCPEFFSARREGIGCGRIINSIKLV